MRKLIHNMQFYAMPLSLNFIPKRTEYHNIMMGLITLCFTAPNHGWLKITGLNLCQSIGLLSLLLYF